MADLRTEQEITKLLEKQYELAEKTNMTTKAGRALKKEILLLERELEIIQSKGKKKETEGQKEILKLIGAREKKLKDLVGQESTSADLKRAAIISQTVSLQLLHKQAGVGGGLTDMMKEQLEVTDSLGSGMNDVSGIQTLQAQSEERLNKINEERKGLLEKLLGLKGQLSGADAGDIKAKLKQLRIEKTIEGHVDKNLNTELKTLKLKEQETAEWGLIDKLTGGLASKAKDFGEKIKNASPEELGFIKATAMLTAGIVVLKTLIGLGQKFAKTFDEIGKKFGSIKLLGKDLQGQLLASNIEAIKLGANIGDIGSITSTLSSDFGMSQKEAADLSVKILDTSTALGLSVDEGTQLFGVLTQTANLSAGQAEKLAEGAAQLARQKGVAPQAVMKDIAGSAETIASFTKDSGENIFEAAIAARQFGLNLDTISKSAKGMLDFESSINAEVEASVLLGKQLNLQKARELGLNKDLVGFQSEIKKQLSGIGDFNELNVIQQEALAKALNMSIPEVAKLANGTKEIGAGLGGKSFEDLLGKDALSTFTQFSNTLSSVGAIMVQSVGPALSVMAGFLGPVIGFVGSLVAGLDSLGALMPMLVVGLGGLGVALTAMGIKAAWATGKAVIGIFVDIAKAVTGMTAAGAGFTLPAALAMGAILGAGAIGIMAKGRSEASKVGDFQYDAATGGVKSSPTMGPLLTLPNGNEFQGVKGDSAMLGKMAPPPQPPQIAPNFGTQNAYEKSFSLLPKEQTFKIMGNDLIARVDFGSTMAGDVGTGLS